MHSIAFSVADLTIDEADVIADAYFRGSKDPLQMARHLGVDSFDLNLLNHPLVKRKIVEKQRDLNQHYSLEEHLTMLKQIRNGAMQDENWKVSLSAEIAVGKAAGLYEPRPPIDPNADPSKEVNEKALTTEEIRRRLLMRNDQPTLAPPEDFDGGSEL